MVDVPTLRHAVRKSSITINARQDPLATLGINALLMRVTTPKFQHSTHHQHPIRVLMRRQLAAGDQLRVIYDGLSKDPNSLANLDQDLPNYSQHQVPIFSLPQEWLWCETWCGNTTKHRAKTIDLCNNPLTKVRPHPYPNTRTTCTHTCTHARTCHVLGKIVDSIRISQNWRLSIFKEG